MKGRPRSLKSPHYRLFSDPPLYRQLPHLSSLPRRIPTCRSSNPSAVVGTRRKRANAAAIHASRHRLVPLNRAAIDRTLHRHPHEYDTRFCASYCRKVAQAHSFEVRVVPGNRCRVWGVEITDASQNLVSSLPLLLSGCSPRFSRPRS